MREDVCVEPLDFALVPPKRPVGMKAAKEMRVLHHRGEGSVNKGEEKSGAVRVVHTAHSNAVIPEVHSF